MPVFDYNYFEEHTILKGTKPLPEGESSITVDFDYAGGGPGKGPLITLKVDGEQVAQDEMDATIGGRFGIDAFGIGEDTGQPVSFVYAPPFKFTGTIASVQVDIR